MTRGVLNDLAGQKFGHLTVVAREASDRQGNAQWSCSCECGRKVTVRGSFLRKRQRYCSSRCPLLLDAIRLDLAGKRFGRLVAVEPVGSAPGRKTVWRFACDCGGSAEVPADYVVVGDTRSCGCLGVESRIKHGLSSTREYHRAAHRKWARENPAKAIENANRRRADFVKRRPPWLTPEHKAQIEAHYIDAATLTQITGIRHHVDHIVPLRGKTVSGLHVPWNLQVLPAADNLRKNRRLPDDIC